MGRTGYIKEDFVTTYSSPQSGSDKRLSLVFGDKVEILESSDGWTKLRCLDSYDSGIRYVKGTLSLSQKGCLKISMVDVQQGDGLIVETPEGKIVFVDGGDNKLFARHAAARYQYKESTPDSPMEVDAIIITHGDADHFEGLNELVNAETHRTKRKRIAIQPKRIYHNGLVKSPQRKNGKTIPDSKRLGTTKIQDGTRYIIDLFDDTREASPDQTNSSFEKWHASLDHWEARAQEPMRIARIAHGMDTTDFFDFLAEEDIHVDLLGPFTDQVTFRGKEYEGLPFLHAHADTPMLHLEEEGAHGSESASHTINGHSLAFRLQFGNIRMLFTGDLNKEALDRMLERVGDPSKLKCEILKAPHHGSHDFAVKALKTAAPVISIVSSGDQDAFHEYIHPRATLMSALGNSSRNDMGILFSTELAAFFTYRKECFTRDALADFFKNAPKDNYTKEELKQMFTGKPRKEDPAGMFHGFERTNFGIIHLRTDGTRLLAFTHSGKAGLNEAYSYTVDSLHRVRANTIKKR
ncbi:ComEC/Rec2 family competence protein [Robiginitalea sediminis]|uniref:ComEC/Rec2 family competence protein n=1 Tax=Robiginitalea sediminis TaxID=1982593 RepID=UPI000B4AEA5F|nr:MBL fold metallo-hydrolase [Robiginitalea sediminis]